jgi:hypothetical protein
MNMGTEISYQKKKKKKRMGKNLRPQRGGLPPSGTPLLNFDPTHHQFTSAYKCEVILTLMLSSKILHSHSGQNSTQLLKSYPMNLTLHFFLYGDQKRWFARRLE